MDTYREPSVKLLTEQLSEAKRENDKLQESICHLKDKLSKKREPWQMFLVGIVFIFFYMCGVGLTTKIYPRSF